MENGAKCSFTIAFRHFVPVATYTIFSPWQQQYRKTPVCLNHAIIVKFVFECEIFET